MLQDTGYSLKKKGYTIKVLNLDEKNLSNSYNPLMYVKRHKIMNEALGKCVSADNKVQEDDVLTLINVFVANTKSEYIENVSGDPFWEKAELLYLQAIFFYVFRHYDKRHQNFTTILDLMRQSEPDGNGKTILDDLFNKWKAEEPNAIGVKQYDHFKIALNAPKMFSTIVLLATTRFTPFNLEEMANLTDVDDMELERIGMPPNDESPLLKQINENEEKRIGNGKIAYFIITKPSDSTYNFIANTFYTQVFSMIEVNAKKCGGSLANPLEIYMDEWSQLGEIPRFVEELAYLRGLNVRNNNRASIIESTKEKV